MKRRLLHLPPKCFRFHFAALSSNSKELPKNFKPQRPPHYRSTHPYVPLGTKLDEFPNAADADGTGPRLYEYWKMGEFVRKMPTASERIEFVNPFQRQWSRFEKKWHREHHPDLIKPRKAWNVPPIPLYFDPLNFYKYITKTRVVEGLDQCFGDLNPPTKTFEKKIIEALQVNEKTQRTLEEKCDFLLRNVVDATLCTLSPTVPHLMDCSVNYNPRCESFWIRSGFLSMYDQESREANPHRRRRRFPCDDIRQLGELTFVLRDNLSVQVRDKHPLSPVFDFSNENELYREIFDDSTVATDDVIYSPLIFNMWPDENPLWQCPGCEPDCGDPNLFGRLALKSSTSLIQRCDFWKVYGEERETVIKDCLTASAVSSLFSWLNGQAHILGYTQYNDIESPLASQLVLFDGQQFFFAFGQLNTIAINIDVKGFVNERSNVCYIEGPFALYDEIEEEKFFHFENGTKIEGLNQHVLKRLVQMFLRV
uniref:28S ribosomal protein S30, mitochondrial n=1 Tax=Syphacia muris TaxID=451379 RepID=A0A0N5ALC7_9BILA